jgi:hypothetical protein
MFRVVRGRDQVDLPAPHNRDYVITYLQPQHSPNESDRLLRYYLNSSYCAQVNTILWLLWWSRRVVDHWSSPAFCQTTSSTTNTQGEVVHKYR